VFEVASPPEKRMEGTLAASVSLFGVITMFLYVFAI
jgi:hypothetical protein